MGYRAFTKDELRYNFVKTKKRWKTEFEHGFILTDERIQVIENCLGELNVINEMLITRLARLARWAELYEIYQLWCEYLDLKAKGEITGSPSKLNFVLSYGANKGEELYNMHQKENSVRTKQISKFGINYWLNKGYTEEEARLLLSKISSNNAKIRWDKVDDEFSDRSEYTKSINPLCKEFVGYSSLSEEEAEKLRSKQFNKCIRGYEYYEKLYGEEKAKDIIKDRNDRRYASMLKNETGIFSATKGSASGWSLEVFNPLVDWIKEHGYTNSDIQMGVEGFRGERWVRDPKDNRKYYLYDFTFLPLNVIIEYHGTRWHPKEDGKFTEDTHLTISGEDKRKEDVYKKTIAENAGYYVLEIWSDDNVETNIQRCKDFLLSHGFSKI